MKTSSDFESEASKEEGEEEPYEEYEVEIDQPYIDATASGGSADKARVFNVGDKVLATSILLDEDYEAKIADFDVTRFVGTHGYIAPSKSGCCHAATSEVVGALFTLHQECVLLDTQGFGNNRKITTFIGGLVLCDGRYVHPSI
ncbi:unnamed protein product [Vicia faba]|uniref:Uncharacterized protein n=1 Tax=Vicia faba TaxID=3906 RepID=A0AAV1BBQ2_VICFA|nr:unnamed protein product [Vicia faba]